MTESAKLQENPGDGHQTNSEKPQSDSKKPESCPQTNKEGGKSQPNDNSASLKIVPTGDLSSPMIESSQQSPDDTTKEIEMNNSGEKKEPNKMNEDKYLLERAMAMKSISKILKNLNNSNYNGTLSSKIEVLNPPSENFLNVCEDPQIKNPQIENIPAPVNVQTKKNVNKNENNKMSTK